MAKIPYEKSFAYYVIEELNEDINKYWNWEKNEISPYDVYRGSGKEVWLYCQNKDYHNYSFEGEKVGYKIKCYKFCSGGRCNYCHSGISIVHYKDSLGYLYPDISKMIAIKENDLIFEDCYKIYPNSHKYYFYKCPHCKKIV